jgi:hypothetical protein
MNISLVNKTDVKAYGSEADLSLGPVAQMFIILGCLFIFLGCLLYAIFKSEKISQLRRKRSSKMRIIPAIEDQGESKGTEFKII